MDTALLNYSSFVDTLPPCMGRKVMDNNARLNSSSVVFQEWFLPWKTSPSAAQLHAHSCSMSQIYSLYCLFQNPQTEKIDERWFDKVFASLP